MTLRQVNPDVVGASVQGEPVVYVSAFVVVVLFGFARSWIESLVTIAHEGGHMAMAALTGVGAKHFHIVELQRADDGSGGATEPASTPGWLSDILISLVGYLTPPLLGLAGVSLVLHGKAWSVLMAAVVLLFVAFLKARDAFTTVVVVLVLAGVGAALFLGSAALQAGIAVAVTWTMLVGGVTTLEGQGWGSKGSDADRLAGNTWIPAFLWVALFVSVAIVCLWVGTRRLIGI